LLVSFSRINLITDIMRSKYKEIVNKKVQKVINKFKEKEMKEVDMRILSGTY